MRDVVYDFEKEWHFKNEKSFKDVLKNSLEKAWWICEKGHEWETSVVSRFRINVGCPYCANRKVCKDNCLLTNFPELSKEWHPTKNKLGPDSVVSGSHKKVWWLCEKGHEWEAGISKRTHSGRNCPYCSNQKVCKDNCLLTNFPELSKEWHPTKNKLGPDSVVSGSCIKVWWICNCGYSWQATPSKRTKQGTGCPICKSSNGERKIAAYLECEGVKYKAQYKFERCKNKKRLPFDFYLPDHNICIEFQGEQHYKPIPYFGGNEKFKKTKARDEIKKKFCDDHGIKLMVIPYWHISCIKHLLKENLYG